MIMCIYILHIITFYTNNNMVIIFAYDNVYIYILHITTFYTNNNMVIIFAYDNVYIYITYNNILY